MENLNAYYVFYTAAREGNLTKAARTLFISQPAVSRTITNLETALKTTLFNRTQKGVTLTFEGELLFRQLDSAFSSIEYGEEQLKSASNTSTEKLSIGVSTTLCKYILLPHLNRFTKENPHVQISIQCQPTNQTIRSMEEENVNIGIVGLPEKKLPGKLCFYPIMEINDVFVATQNYLKRFDRTHMTSKEILKSATLMLLDSNNLTRQFVDRYLNINQITGEQILEVSTMDLLIEFAKIDLGIACVIESFVRTELEDNTLIELQMDPPLPKRQIGILLPKNNPGSSALRFLEFMKKDKKTAGL